jgi:hypothetical protein
MDIKLMPDKYKKKGIGGGLRLSDAGLPKFFNQLASKANFWVILSLVLLIGVILVCFGLWGYKISLNKNKESLTKRLEELQSQRDLDLEASFIELKERIGDFEDILGKRIYPLNVFKMLEELTLPHVQYTSFGADLTQLTVSLKTEAANYNTLAKQVLVFKEDSRIKKVEFSEVNLGKAGWVVSDLKLKLNPDFLYYE